MRVNSEEFHYCVIQFVCIIFRYLDVNDITVIQAERLNHLKYLARLDLSNNQLQVLSNFTFVNLTNLSTL